MSRWRVLALVVLVVAVIGTLQVRVVRTSRALALETADGQAVVAFKQHGYWCLGYYRDWRGPATYCDLSVAVKRDSALLQRVTSKGLRVDELRWRK